MSPRAGRGVGGVLSYEDAETFINKFLVAQVRKPIISTFTHFVTANV